MAVSHPSQDVIARFAQGRLPLAEAARWEQHFVICEQCGEQLAQVGSDHFIDLLKQSAVVEDTKCNMDTQTQYPELPIELRNHSRYAIQKRLGQGGMGMVYYAMHRLMNRPVALKMIRGDLLSTPVAVTRFRREVQAAAQLHHANIVTAFDAEEVSGVHFLVMEYVEGKSLDQLVNQKGPLAVPLACGIAKQIAQGLHHAHHVGMIHRDIKPNNVMITRQGKVKILDFGLASWSGRRDEMKLTKLTRAGSHLGTLMYAAPEQRKSAGDVDIRADLYSLGATLVYLLTGKPPPLAKTDAPTEELSLPSEVPPELQSVIKRLLMPLPEDRYASAKAVVDALAVFSSSSNLNAVTISSGKGLRYALTGSLVLVLVLMALLAERYLRRGNEISLQQTAASTAPVPMVQATRPTPANATKAIEARTDHWQSLLPMMNPRRDTVAGQWSLTRDGLVVWPIQGGRIMLPVKIPVEYDLRITFTRRSGKDSIGAVIVHGGKQCTFELDAWEQHLAGFQNIDGQGMRENSTRREDYELENNRRYILLIEVRANSIRAVLNDKEVTKYTGDGKNLSIDDRYWAMPQENTLGLLSWMSQTIFHEVEMRPR